MRYRKPLSLTLLVLLVSFIFLTCYIQQCTPLAFSSASAAAIQGAGSAVSMSTALGASMVQSMLQTLASSLFHSISTFQTMAFSMISGFMMGLFAFTSFLIFLMNLVPPEEEERRGLGFVSAAEISLQNSYPALAHFASILRNVTLEESVFLRNLNLTTSRNATTTQGSPPSIVNLEGRNSRRVKRDLLVKNVTSPTMAQSNNTTTFRPVSLESIARITNASADSRIPRFLTRLVQRDPFNCLPLLMCGLSAARSPNERTDSVNDYAYLLKELLDDVTDPDDKSEDEDNSSPEDDLYVEGKMSAMSKIPSRFRSPIDFGGNRKKNKEDDVEKILNDMAKEEDERIEELVLTELAEDPEDMKYAMQDMKIHGLKKTLEKMPPETKRKYLQKLMKHDSSENMREEEEEEEEEDDLPVEHMSMMGYGPRHDFHDEDDYDRPYYDWRGLTRGGYPPPPPEPPVPQYGHNSGGGGLFKRRMGPPPPEKQKQGPSGKKDKVLVSNPFFQVSTGRRRVRRQSVWSKQKPAPPRGFLQKKRGELMETDNIYDRARIGSEVGAVARNNRQCRAFFQACPKRKTNSSNNRRTQSASSSSNASRKKSGGNNSTLSDTAAAVNDDDETPFLNRAVNNIRRVLLGPQPASKSKREKEIREIIRELQTPTNHGGSEVKVVLNIGPPPPNGQPGMISSTEVHRGGLPGMQPVSPYVLQTPAPTPLFAPQPIPTLTAQDLGLPPPFSAQLLPKTNSTRYTIVNKKPIVTTKRPTTTSKPTPKPTKKVMVYHKPSSTSASKKPLPPLFSVSSPNLDKLATLLQPTLPPIMLSDEEEPTTLEPIEETTVVPIEFFEEVVQGSGENDEKSVEEDQAVPTKYPVSREEYVQNLRETFDIFNRFKEAHRNAPGPPTTAEAVQHKTQNRIVSKHQNTGQSTSSQVSSASGNKKKISVSLPPSSSGSGGSNTKGDTGDSTLGDVDGDDDDDDDEDEDIASVWESIKSVAGGEARPGDVWEAIKDTIKDYGKDKKKKKKRKKKRRKKKKKKKKGKGKGDSSEESSEEEHHQGHHLYPSHPPLIAVPHPDQRPKVHWRSGTQLVKDKFYQLIFGRRAVKPLDSYEETGHAPPYPSIWRNSYKDDDEQPEDEEKKTTPQKKKKPGNSRGSAPSVLLIAAPTTTKATRSQNEKIKTKGNKGKGKKSKKKSKPKPTRTPTPIPTFESFEVDEEDEDHNFDSRSLEEDPNHSGSEEVPNDSGEYEGRSGMPQGREPSESEEYPQYPIRPNGPSSTSNSGSYEEDDDNDNDPMKPQLLYNPFTVVAPKRRDSDPERENPRKKKKGQSRSSLPTQPKQQLNKVKITFADLYGKNTTKTDKIGRPTGFRTVVSSTTTTTKRPRRKMLKYKSG